MSVELVERLSGLSRFVREEEGRVEMGRSGIFCNSGKLFILAIDWDLSFPKQHNS
jgi:hypothetical protein